MNAPILIALAGLMGAAGIVLLAASAHTAPGVGLDSAGTVLVLHAAALLAGAGALSQALISRPIGFAALVGLMIGAALFSGDIALRAFSGHRLFPMAAPTGGTILIASWLLLSVGAIVALVRGN